MHVLSIDVGTYSVKYISSFVEKRKVVHVEMSEVNLKEFQDDHPEMSVYEAQASIVHELIESTARGDTKIILQADNGLMTTRFLTLPVKSKKKAEQMLPFQLEEDIPYALSEIHFAYRMELSKTQWYALVGLVREDAFETYYESFKAKDALPNILTSEASAVENYFNQNAIAGPFCVLDIGHKTTKAYFFYNSRLIVTHVSYVGGQDINEMISLTYKIDMDEAIKYKHQNAFLLTTAQMSEVEPAQKEFASAMDKVFQTLVGDFTRWKIGYKVNYGLSLSHVYICGGTTNIKNIANYLTEKWDTKVVLLETFDKVESSKIDLNAKNKSKYGLANMMATGMRQKNRFINLLNGKFAQASGVEIPLHSFAYIASRATIITVLLVVSLMVERFFISEELKAVNASMTSVIKNNSASLGITAPQRRKLTTEPQVVYDRLVKNQKGIKQEITSIQSAVEIESLSPLVTVSQAAASTEATLTEFKSSETGEISTVFTAEKVETLTQLKAALEASRLSDVKVIIDNDGLKLNMTATEK